MHYRQWLAVLHLLLHASVFRYLSNFASIITYYYAGSHSLQTSIAQASLLYSFMAFVIVHINDWNAVQQIVFGYIYKLLLYLPLLLEK